SWSSSRARSHESEEWVERAREELHPLLALVRSCPWRDLAGGGSRVEKRRPHEIVAAAVRTIAQRVERSQRQHITTSLALEGSGACQRPRSMRLHAALPLPRIPGRSGTFCRVESGGNHNQGVKRAPTGAHAGFGRTLSVA